MSTNAALAWAAEQTATFYSLLASKLKDAGEDAPAGSLFEGVRGRQLAVAGAGTDAGEEAAAAPSKKAGKRGSKKSKADKPKRPPSAYNVFIVQESAKLKAAGFKSDRDHSAFSGLKERAEGFCRMSPESGVSSKERHEQATAEQARFSCSSVPERPRLSGAFRDWGCA